MKRPPHTFVVEVRRQRRSTNSDVKAWSAEPPFADAPALVEAEPKAPIAAEAPPSRPQGRILPSLVDLEPIAPPVEDAAASPRRRRGGLAPTPKPKTRAKPDWGGKSPPPGPSAAAPKRKTDIAAPRANAERRAGVLATLAVAEDDPGLPDAGSRSATAEPDGARQARHRRILERYVLGAEIKPGERWKRRLQKAR